MVRPETDADRAAIHQVNQVAFGREVEARLVDLLREEPGYGPSLVAEIDGQVAGHILFSQAWILGEDGVLREVSNLAPVAVLPEFQGRGIGSALIRQAMATIFIPIIVLGHETYYPRFGFEPASEHGIEWAYIDEDPTPPEFMVWVPAGEWSAYRGRAVYPPPFAAVEE